MSLLGRFFAGIRILDLSHYLPGPMATLFLRDMGADVIKIVPPTGDGLRKVGPTTAEGEPLFYGALNAGKNELTLDLKKEEDKANLRTLAGNSDVLVEGFRPGTLARLGFDPVALLELNPRLIICSISSYGADGPLAAAAAHDANLLADNGITARNDECMIDPPIVDCAAALFAALSMSAALYHRDRNGGRGCIIDIGLSDVMMPLQAMQIEAFGRTGWMPKPRSYYINGGLARYNQYHLRDHRRVVLGALELKFWEAFCKAAARPDWSARHADPEPQAALIAELANFFSSMTLQECEIRFAGIDCCLTPVVDLNEALKAPQTRHRDLVRAHGNSIQALYPAYVDGEAPDCRPPLQHITALDALGAFCPRNEGP